MVKYIRESKKVQEANDQIDLDIKFNKNMQMLPDDIVEEMYDYGSLEFYPKDDDVPMPWDADMAIDDGKLIFVGGVGPSGFGRCRCEIPIDQANNFYTVHVRTKSPKVIAALYQYGWLDKK